MYKKQTTFNYSFMYFYSDCAFSKTIIIDKYPMLLCK